MANKTYYYDERFLWKSGSSCTVYSRSYQQWFKGKISDIFMDVYTNKEWFIVKYNPDFAPKKKYIQRLCKHIKPIANNLINTVWIIGKNQYNECGQTLRDRSLLNMDDDTGDYCKILQLCKWSLDNSKFKHIFNINRGFGFNIYSVATHRDELIVFGFIQSIQSILAKYEIYIPNRVYLKVLMYFGHTYNKYYSIGNNDFGELGIGHNNKVDELTNIDNNIPAIRELGILKICTGSAARNICWITNCGELYVHGQNLQKYNNKKSNDYEYEYDDKSEELTSIPTINTDFDDKRLLVVDGACSYFHCMIVCDNGSVWSLGKGNYGELGHGSNQHLFTDNFVKIKSLNKRNIISVSCGSYFSLFLDGEGDVFSCGSNKYGQCGLGHQEQNKNRLPTKMDYFIDEGVIVTQIRCGLYHSVALDSDGYVYCWGRNNIGQCARNIKSKKDKILNSPRLLHHLMEYQITDIKTGCNHSMAKTENRDYYMWGCNDFNECCCDTNNRYNNGGILIKPNCINKYVDKITQSHEIIDISLGSCNTMIIVRGIDRYTHNTQYAQY